jgi:hypothetical protein
MYCQTQSTVNGYPLPLSLVVKYSFSILMIVSCLLCIEFASCNLHPTAPLQFGGIPHNTRHLLEPTLLSCLNHHFL